MVQKKDFKNLLDFTDYIKSLPAGTSKKITLRNISKVTTHLVYPPIDENGRYVGGVKTREQISRAEADSGKYIATPESKVKLEEGTVFDLDDEMQKVDWEWVKYLRCVGLTKEETLTDKDKIFYVELPELEAVRAVSKFETKQKAYTLVSDIATDELPEAGTSLGMNVDSYAPSQIRSMLYQKADDDPAKLIATLQDPDYAIILLFLKAKSKGIIYYQDSIYRYGDISLGFTESQVKEFLKDKKANKEIIESIVKELETRSKKK